MKFNTDLSKIHTELTKGDYTLFDHQKRGVKWLLKTEKKLNGGLLADEMGLGKTIQIISMLIANPKALNLIVCPASLVNQWESELHKFAPSIKVYKNFIYELDTSIQNVFIISYNKINRPHVCQLEYDRVICDEAHYFRNSKSKTFKNLYDIKATYRWCITGTPIQNYKKDIKTIFKFLRKDGKVSEMISKYMLRRTHDQLKFNLPKLQHSVRFIKTHNSPFMKMIEENDYMFHLEKVLRLKQACVVPSQTLNSIISKYSVETALEKLKHLKLNTIIKDMKNLSGKKTIIFSYFRSEIRYLYENLKYHIKIDYIDGSTNSKKKTQLIHSKEHEALIIQINAGGTGLNLQHYNNVIFTAPQWNPTLEQQAVARVYRIGQINEVNVKRYIVGKMNEYSIEKKILSIQKYKIDLIKKYIN